MSTLVMRLSGPWQAWGTSSRFTYRMTDRYPSKSGIIGMLAAAQGRRRYESLTDLLDLRFGVRIDQPGEVERDFQTAISLDEKTRLPLTERFYIADAVFIAAVEGEDALIEGLAESLATPRYPLYLGRRSCPPSKPVLLGVRSDSFTEVLEGEDESIVEPWAAESWWKRRQPGDVQVKVVRDALPGEVWHDRSNDQPVNFDPHRRQYVERPLVHSFRRFVNTRSRSVKRSVTAHDPSTMWE